MVTKALMSVAEFASICEQLGPCELIRGEVVSLSPGGYQHSRLSVKIAFLIEKWAVENNRGRVIGNEAGLIVASEPDTVRGADIAYVSFDRLPKGSMPPGFFETPPELVVEIVGKGQGWTEKVEKVGEYLRMGVDRVWVIDPDTRRVHIFRGDAEPAILAPGATLEDEAILPRFSCPVDELFTD